MTEILECPVCKNKDLQKINQCTDYTVSHETFDLRLCSSCTLVITTPRPDSNKLGDYYKSEEYISHSGKSSGGLGFLYKIARSISLNWKKSLIEKFHQKGSILDFGCGTGEFIHCMKQSAWKVNGLEVSDAARKKAEELNDQKISQSLEEIYKESFEVVTAWHVLEHVSDLVSTLNQLKGLLKKNGTIFIAVPNYQSPDGEKYKEYWAGYDVPRHLWHFSKQSMTHLLESAGLKLIDIVPMKLDAYYVSMLSEKYRNNNVLTTTQLIRGFFSGLSSNLRAGSNNHSSLIYIASIHER